MAKQIDHIDGASMITALKFVAGVCLFAGFGAGMALLMLSDIDNLPFIEAGILAASGVFSWVTLSVFAYVAQCVGRIAVHADRLQRTPEAPENE